MRPCVAIDVDDTIAVFSEEAARVLSKATGIQHSYSKWTSHDWCEMYKIEATEARNLVKKQVVYQDLKITSGVWPELHKAIEAQNITPLYVTARSNILGLWDARKITHRWLRSMGIPALESQVLPVEYQGRKSEFLLQNNWNVVASIEDHIREHLTYIRDYPQGMHVLIESPISRNTNFVASKNPKWPVYGLKNLVKMREHLLQFIQQL